MGAGVGPARSAEAAPEEESPAAEAPAARTFTNADCLDCHTDPTLTKTRQGREVPLAAVDTNLFTRFRARRVGLHRLPRGA